jgi:hypothetical protein
MQGTVHEPGVLPQAVAYLFALRRHVPALLSVRVLEVAGNVITDLLSADVLRAAGVQEGQIHSAPFHNHVVREVLLTRRTQALTLLAEVVGAQKRVASGARGPGVVGGRVGAERGEVGVDARAVTGCERWVEGVGEWVWVHVCVVCGKNVELCM